MTSFRKRGCALAAAMLVIGCAPGIPLPGDGGSDVNLPPLILAASIEETESGLLRLRVAAVDPNLDPVVITYEQVTGPFAVQRSQRSIAGAFEAILEPTESGLHAFRVAASDGLLEPTTEVSIVVSDPPAARLPPDAVAATLGRVPAGRFDIQLSGQVVADEGRAAFALDGNLVVDAADAAAFGGNVATVSIRTRTVTSFTQTPHGAVMLDSEQLGEDVLDVAWVGDELVVSGPIALGEPLPGQFKTAEARVGWLDIAAVFVRIRISGDVVSGEVFLSSRSVVAEDLPLFAEYAAHFTGRRIGS